MVVSTLSTVMNDARTPAQDVTTTNPQPTTQKSTRIFIVGHQDFSLDGLAAMLENQIGNFQVSCVEPDEKCMEKFTASSPDCLLIQNDSLPQPFERFIHNILNHFPGIRILVFGKGMSDDHLYHLIRAGVHGYVNERMGGEHF